MKRITCALLSLFIITPCFANIHIHSEIVESVITQKIPDRDAQVAAAAEYNAQVKKANNAGIPASGIWQVCKAAGWDTQTADGETKCRDFGNTLMKDATWKFKAVCGDDKSLVQKGTGECVGDVFSNKVLGGVKVNMLVASGLAKECARVKYNDKDLVCSKKPRQTKLPPDDYVQCLSMNKNMAYEFRFDSVTATNDNVITEGTESGVCKIFGLKYSPSGSQQAQYLGNGQQISPYQSWPAACETTDAKVCSKVNESITKFGRSAKIGSTGSKGHTRTACVINKNAISSPSQLRTAFGIDNYVFKKGGVQLNATQTLKNQVCTYVRTTVKSPTITSCDCNDGFTQLYDFSGMITQVDDVLTCKINGKNVDFVFDDLSENLKTIAKGGAQGMDCIAWGGTFTGKKCIGLDEKMCNTVRDANAQSCPECKLIKWNDKTKICELPASASATNLKRGLNYTAIAGGAVISVVVTIGTLGAASAPTAVILTGLAVETIGAGIELKAQVDIDKKADEFFTKSANCSDANCAEQILKEYFQYISRMTRDLTDEEKNATDKEMARLTEMIPNDSQFMIDIVSGCYEDSDDDFDISKCDDGVWNPDQIIRAVGIGLQFTSVFASVGKWVVSHVQSITKQTPKLTTALQKKIPSVKNSVQKSVNEGKKVKTSNGKEPLWIRTLKNTIPEVEARIEKLLDNMFGQKLAEISRMRSQQANMERDFIARNKGMLFHGSATDYKEGTVEALSKAWQIHATPNVKGLLFADPDFYEAKRYTYNGFVTDFGVYSQNTKDYSNTLRLPIPKKYVDKFKDIAAENVIFLHDQPRKYSYVYAVKPDGFRTAGNVGPGTYMMIEHDVERIDRIKIPLDIDVIFVREGVLLDHESELNNLYDGLMLKMGQAVNNIDNNKNVLKNLLIYEEYLEKLSKIIQ